MQHDEFAKFFQQYSANVDNADNSYYWKLSDQVILELIRTYIPASEVGSSSVVLDAGGGTGRWIVKLSQVYDCRFHLYDLSEHMLERAHSNLSAAGIEDRVQVTMGDLCDMHYVAEESVDHVVSIYGPLSFIDEPERAVAEIARVLKPGGRAMLMSHGYYNSLASKIAAGIDPAQLLTMCETSTVKWADHVPILRTYSAADMEALFEAAGMAVVATHGVTSLIEPGPEDFDPTNVARSAVSTRLEDDPEFFATVLELELRYGGLPAVVNRGTNLIAVGEKR